MLAKGVPFPVGCRVTPWTIWHHRFQMTILETSTMRIVSIRAFTVLLLASILLSIPQQARAEERVNRDRKGIAIDGYDPVAYFVDSKPVQGRPEFEYTVNGTRYLFASAANRDRFAQNPSAYIPQYGGFCAYAVSLGKTADIDPEAWSVVEGRLFLNYSKSVQAQWAEDIPGNIAKGDANWPKLHADLAG